MQQGEVIDIFITPNAGTPLQSVQDVRAFAGRGLEGDRYFNQIGSFSKQGKKTDPGQEISLIEIEAIEALARDASIVLDPGDSRRHILTRGIALNHLVGCEFSVGPVRLRGIKLCEPCGHLESLTQPGVKKGLTHRGGLRAQILNNGVLRVGDAITIDQKTHVCA